MNEQNILGHFKEGESITLVIGTGRAAREQAVLLLQDVDFYAVMDEWRTSLIENPDVPAEDILLFLADEGIVDLSQRDVIDAFRLDPSIPSRAHVDVVHEKFPYLAEMAAAYSLEDNKVDKHRLPANTAFNEIVKGVVGEFTFNHVVNMDITAEGYLVWFFNMFDTAEGRNKQRVNLFNYLVNNLLMAHASQLVKDQNKEFDFYTRFETFPDKSKLNHAYTVGFSAVAGLEFITASEEIFGEDLDEFLNAVANRYARDRFELTGVREDLASMEDDSPARVTFLEVPVEPALAFYLRETNGEVKRVVQIITADRNNKLPGEEGFDQFYNQRL